MQIITVAGPASTGKTSIILHMIRCYQSLGMKTGVVKFDCLTTDDDKAFRKSGVPVLTGISGNVCPDHYYVASILPSIRWGQKKGLDILILESAGLCNRCSPHLQDIAAVCVIDNLMGAKIPRKIGPMLKKADIIAVTKGDVVSQAEREVFAFYIRQANPRSIIMQINGITGQGCSELAELLLEKGQDADEYRLRFTMPAAVCAYCVGERNIREEFSLSTMRELEEYEEQI